MLSSRRHHHHQHNRFTALFAAPPGWASARRELLDFMVLGKINRGRYTTIWLGATPSGLTSAHLHHPIFLQAGCPSYHPTNSDKALKATSTGVIRQCIRNDESKMGSNFPQCFHGDGWVPSRHSAHRNPCHLSPKVLLQNNWREKTKWGAAESKVK